MLWLRAWSAASRFRWGLVSGPLKPSPHAGLGRAMPNPAPFVRPFPVENFDFAAGAPPCRTRCEFLWLVRSPVTLPNLSISRRLVRPQSPFRFRAFGGCASGERDREYSESARSTLAVEGSQNVTSLTPLGHTYRFVFGYRLGWGTLWGHPPHPGPAVHSDGDTALHKAAFYGNCQIVRLLIAVKAAVDAQDRWRCAVSALASTECDGRVPALSAVQAHATAQGRAIWQIRSDRRAAPEWRRRGHPERRRVTLRCAAQPTGRTAPSVQAHAKAMRRK